MNKESGEFRQIFSVGEMLCRNSTKHILFMLDLHQVIFMNLEKEYTDVRYLSKQEVADEVGRHLVDPVWQQICAYRKEFAVSVCDVEFCLCPGILWKLLQFQEMLLSNRKMEYDSSLLCTYDYAWLFHHYLKSKGDIHKRVHDLCILFQSSEEIQIISVINLSVPAVCKVIWVLIHFQHTDFQILLCALICHDAGMDFLIQLLKHEDFMATCQKDATYVLASCLDEWMKQIYLDELKEKECPVDYDTLLHLYPQLKKYQIQFYLDHHEPGFYYTIEQFIAYSDVCYETGRCALKQMVDLGFYQMLKQGKKFLYTVR